MQTAPWNHQYASQAAHLDQAGTGAESTYVLYRVRAAAMSRSSARKEQLLQSERSKQCAGTALRSVPIVKAGFSVGCRDCGRLQ